MLPNDIEAFLHLLCNAAANETLPRFRIRLEIENKLEGGFDPVTAADKAAEAAIRALIRQHYPDHGILGEEEAPLNPDAEYCWHIDPVDGTRAFICGLPSWGTLIGLARNRIPVAGVMHQPYTGEFFLADGTGSFHIRDDNRSSLMTSSVSALEQAKLMTTSPAIFSVVDKPRYQALETRVKLARYGFDCYAYAMLASGHIDLVVESELKSYDIAPLIPVIEQAGGVVTTWDGDSAINGGRIVAAANGALHARALEVLLRG
jgi:histidinol-phosphatase